MSDIVQMTSTVGEYVSGSVYRLRSRETNVLELANKLIVLDTQTEPTTTIEGE